LGGDVLKDEKIIELFFERNEEAIAQTEIKYSGLCHYITSNILALRQDREECISDALLSLWNNIPPDRPKSLAAYLGTVLRRLALDRSRAENAWKRGKGVQTVGEEFLELIEDGRDLAEDYETKRAARIVNDYLGRLGKTERKIFILRYWADCSIAQIAEQTGYGESKIKMTLLRTRNKLREELGKEGITV
jgi:RNA polymerase sigma-70 factor (ECF subfamily)